MKWIRRALLILLAIPLVAAALLLIASQRPEAGRARTRIEILAPPSDVFRHIVDPGLLEQWTGLSEIEPIDELPIRVGTRARAALVARGQRTELESEVTAFEEDRLLSLVLRTTGNPPVRFTQLSEYELEERAGGTLLAVTADTTYDGFVPGLLEPLLTPVAQKELERQLGQLKILVETSTESGQDDGQVAPGDTLESGPNS